MAAVYQCGDSEGWFGTKNIVGGKTKRTEPGTLLLKLDDDATTFRTRNYSEKHIRSLSRTVEWVSSNGHSHGDQVTWWVF